MTATTSIETLVADLAHANDLLNRLKARRDAALLEGKPGVAELYNGKIETWTMSRDALAAMLYEDFGITR